MQIAVAKVKQPPNSAQSKNPSPDVFLFDVLFVGTPSVLLLDRDS